MAWNQVPGPEIFLKAGLGRLKAWADKGAAKSKFLSVNFTPIRITITMKTERFITVGALLLAAGCLWSTRSSSQESIKKAAETEKVTGIGGVFMKARDPKAMAAWYRAHLGIQVKNGYADFDWREQENPDRLGRTVWSLFPTNTTYFGSSTSPYMINYRVANLDRMIEQLKRGAVAVEKVK